MELRALSSGSTDKHSDAFLTFSATSDLPFLFPDKKGQAQDDNSSIDSFVLKADTEHLKPWYIMLPDSFGRRLWETLVVLVMLYVATALPYRIAFNIFGPEWLAVDIVVDAIFLIDIFVNFFTAYRKWNGKVTVSHRKIVLRYLRTWFIIDLVSILPFYLILPDPDNVNRLTRLLRLTRFLGIVKLLRLVKVSVERPSFFRRNQEYLSIENLLSKLVWFFFWAFLAVHVSCCIWIYIASNAIHDGNSQNWLNAYFGPQLAEASQGTIYLSSIYWSVTLFATVGLGDVVAQNNEERGYSVLVMVLGVAFYSYVISAVSRIVTNLDHERTERSRRFDALDILIQHHPLPKDLVAKIRKYLFRRNEKSEPTDLVFDLPSKLRNEVLLEIHSEVRKQIPFLADKAPSFAAEMLAQLRVVFFEGGMTIAEKNDFPSEMYFLASGQIEMFDPEHPQTIHLMEEGNFFGEGCLFSGRHPFSYRSKGPVQLFFITKKSLKPIVDNHPDVLLLLKLKNRLREIRHHIRPDPLKNSSGILAATSKEVHHPNEETLQAILRQLGALQQSNLELKKMVLDLQQQKSERKDEN